MKGTPDRNPNTQNNKRQQSGRLGSQGQDTLNLSFANCKDKQDILARRCRKPTSTSPISDTAKTPTSPHKGEEGTRDRDIQTGAEVPNRTRQPAGNKQKGTRRYTRLTPIRATLRQTSKAPN